MSIQKQIEKAKVLPIDQHDEWVMEMRPFDVHFEELGEGIKPDLLVCMSPSSDMVLGSNILPPGAFPSEILSWIVKCMLKPMFGEPRRPGTLTLSKNLAHLQMALAQLGITIRSRAKPHPMFDELLSELQEDIVSPGEPTYTIETGVNPSKVADFFSAATEFYKVKPWSLIDGEIPIKVSFLIKSKPVDYWAIVMGAAGQEFGISLYRKAEDLEKLFEAENDGEVLSFGTSTWMLGFSFVHLDEAGPLALKEYLAYGWTIANESAYPSAIMLDPKNKGDVNRPNNKQLMELTAVTRALSMFFKAHKKAIKEQEEALEDTVQIEAAGEQVRVHIDFPSPEFLEDFEDLDEEDEGDMFKLPELLPARPSTPLDRAQNMVYMAWDETGKTKRKKLAEQAIIISPDCTDAYLILAEDAARNAQEKEKYIRQALEAGKRTIGEDWEELEGHFWHALETRPYMRARLRLAECLIDQEQLDQAISEYQDILRLNPNDNQGVRYPLASLLLRAGRDDELQKLLKEYKDDISPFLPYARALLSYRQSGESVKANNALKKAIAANGYVVDYLLERVPLPKYSPEMYSPGSKDEAILCAEIMLEPWKATEGAAEWLRKVSVD